MDHAPIYYNAETVRGRLTWPLVIEAVEVALKAVSNTVTGDTDSSQPYVNQPQRSITVACNDRSKVLLNMPAFVGSYSLKGEGTGGDADHVLRQTLACKLVTSFNGNPHLPTPLPSIMAHIALFNSNTGELDAIMAGTDITNWRTVAASLVATKYLYFRRYGPQAEQQREITLAIVGCGVQGQLHAQGMCANFNVKRVKLWNRTESKARDLSERLRREFGAKLLISVCNSSSQAVDAADVICIATYSENALICASELRKERALHINAVGAGAVHYGEVANDIYAEANVYVDCRSNADTQLCGLNARIVGEVGEVIINGNYPEENEITIFQSMGMASEDACAAQAVHEALMSDIKEHAGQHIQL